MRHVRLRFHLGVLILGTLLPVLAFSAAMIALNHRQTREATEKGLLETARALSLAVDREVGTSISVLHALAASESLRAADLKGFDQFARSVMATQAHWENVVLYDFSGHQLINLRVPFGVPLPPAGDRETLEMVVSTRTPQVSNLFLARVGRVPKVNVYVPVVQDGAVPYVLAAGLSPSQMTGVLQQQKLPEDSVGSLLDRNKVIIARTSRAEQYIGQPAPDALVTRSTEMAEGSTKAITKDGVPVYAAFSRSPLTGWTVALGVPTAVVDAPLRRSLFLLAGLAALVTALGIVVAAGAARRIGRPIVALSKVAPRLVGGEPVAIPRSSVSEVDEVGQALEAAHRERQSVAEQNRRLWEETERRRRAAEGLAEVGWLISRSLDPEGVGEAIVTAVRRLLDAKLAVLYRVERDSQDLVLMARLGEAIALPQRLSRGTAMVGLAIRERRPVTTPDMLNDPRIELPAEVRATIEAAQYRAVLALPLLVRDEVVGALGIGALPGRVYSDEEVHLAQQFCQQAAIALENATLYEAAQRQLRHTETLLAVTQAVGSTLDLAEVLRQTTRAMAQALGAELGWAWRLTPDGDRVIPLAGYKVREGIQERVLALAGTQGHRLAEATKNLTELVWSSDCLNDPRVSDHPWLQVVPPQQSVVMIPLRMREATVGGFILGWTQASHPVTAEERELLHGMAQAASVAIGNADLVETAAQHRARLQALLETSRALSRIQPLESLLKQIADACGQLLDSPSVGIRLVEGDELVLRATVGDADAIMLTPRLKIGEGLTAGVAENGDLLMVTNPADDPRHIASHRAADKRLGYRGWLGVPIKSGPRTLGVLVVRTRRESGFSDADQAIATAFAAQAATAIENARLYQEIQCAYQELRSTKDQLTQSQKMEAIGRLAGGVAHDFNNLLTVIIGRLHLLRYGLKAGDPLYREFEVIEQAAFRAATLTRQLLAFSRKQVLQLKALDLNTVVNEVAPMLRRLIGEDIELTVALGSGMGRVMADSGQLEQVLMNLAVNARDAMPSGGRLALETANVQLDAAFAGEHPGASYGPHVMVAVSDTGIGMSPDIRAQIFEPFFTTKEVGKGTGLGLSMVYGIVKQHQGYICVESEVGVGSVFRVYLPRAEQPAESLEPSMAPAGPVGGRETILLAEDEPGVRHVARKTLQSNGYTVLEAEDVEEAVRIADRQGVVIDLLLTDVVMPRLSGPDLANRVRRRHPETRVLYMSGYTDTAIVHHGVLDPGTAFLQKPFTPDSLALKVREVLDLRGRATGDDSKSSAIVPATA